MERELLPRGTEESMRIFAVCDDNGVLWFTRNEEQANAWKKSHKSRFVVEGRFVPIAEITGWSLPCFEPRLE